MKFIDLGDRYTEGGDPTMNIIITRVPVFNGPDSLIIELLWNSQIQPCCEQPHWILLDGQ